MANIKLKGNGQIMVMEAEVDVPHKDEILTFVYPLKGPVYSNRNSLLKEIDSENLLRPTTAQLISLLDLSFKNEKDPICEEILYKFVMREGDNGMAHLLTSTENFFSLDGVIVYDNIDGKMPSTEKGLMKLVKAGDEKTRFVPGGFKTTSETNWLSISDFLKNPYTIAQVGEDMLPVLERVAKKINKEKAYLDGSHHVNMGSKGFTIIHGYCGNFGFFLEGNSSGRGLGGYVLGIKKRN